MWDKEEYQAVLKVRGPKNILRPPAVSTTAGNATWYTVTDQIAMVAQYLISQVDDHRHLKNAQILLLLKFSPAQEKKLSGGQRYVIGKAAKANGQMRLLSRIGKGTKPPADFVVWFNGDWMAELGLVEIEEDGTLVSRLKEADGESLARCAALIDHELSHCGAKICGEFVAVKELDGFVQDLGVRHVATQHEFTDETGRVLVRFYKTKSAGGYEYCMRKHDVEEFNSVASRHGPWNPQLGSLVDELKESQAGLFAESS